MKLLARAIMVMAFGKGVVDMNMTMRVGVTSSIVV
jgi:hypothetical protein